MGAKLPREFVDAVGWVRAFNKAEQEAAADGDPGGMLVPAFGRLNSLDPESLRLAMAQLGYCFEVLARHQGRPDCVDYRRKVLGAGDQVLH